MSMKLVILGLLMEKESHPYEIKQTMMEREMHHYIKMRDGSLYYAIEQLKKMTISRPLKPSRTAAGRIGPYIGFHPPASCCFKSCCCSNFRKNPLSIIRW